MDPVTLTTTIITIAGAVCKSYEQISKLVTLVRNASKELEGIRSRAGSIDSLVANLKQALEESAIRRVIEKDELALKHVRALDGPLKDVESTLDEVVDKLTKQYRPTTNGKHYKIRWQYYLSHSDWKDLQERLNSHIQVLGVSMQGLNTYVFGLCPPLIPNARAMLTAFQVLMYYVSSAPLAKTPQEPSVPMPNPSLKPQKVKKTHWSTSAHPLPFQAPPMTHLPLSP